MGDLHYEKNTFPRSTSTTKLQHDIKSTAKALLRPRSFHEMEHLRKNRAASIAALEELVQCGICLDVVSEPRMLPCQHTFCFTCLQGYFAATAGRKIAKKHPMSSQDELNLAISKSDFKIHCPSCQIPVRLGKGVEGLKQLPSNVYIDSLLKLLEGYNDSVPDEVIEVADQIEERCVNCQTICSFGDDECGHCKQVFCKICWSHHLSSLKSNLSTLIEHLEESEVRLESRLDDFNDRCNKVADNIKTVTTEKIAEIKTQEQSTLEEIDKIKRKEKGAAKTLRKRVENLKTSIEELSFELIPTDKQKVEIFLNFHRGTSTVLDEISHLGGDRLVFDPHTYKLEQIAEFRNNNGKVNFQNPLESVESMSTFYLTNTFSPKLIWTKCPRPAGLGIPPWAPNLLFIAATDRKVVLIMDRNMSKVIGKLFSPQMLCPHGVAFSEKSLEIYVSDKWKHCIHIFSSEGDYLRTICSLGSGAGELRSPEGIAVTEQNDLVICDAGNDRVVIVNSKNGQYLNTLGIVGNRTELQAPTGVAVYKDKIIVADNRHNRIKIFSTNGKKLFEFGSLGSNRGQFRTAEVVACDPLGFILVGDAGNARVQIFQPDGTLVKVIGSFGEAPGQFGWISGIAVTAQLEIIVTDFKNRRLQIF